MLQFKILLSDGNAIDNNTVLTGKNGVRKLSTELDICNFIKAHWCKATQVKSFTQWADELNEDENFSGGFTKDGALDNLASNYTLNINNKYIDLYEFFMKYKPFKVA